MVIITSIKCHMFVRPLLSLKHIATSIEMNWDPLSEAASYSVRYRVVERVARRNLDDMYTIVETTNTNIIITGLDPRLGYAVSVASRTSVGVGNYSEEITIGCKLTSMLVNATR